MLTFIFILVDILNFHRLPFRYNQLDEAYGKGYLFVPGFGVYFSYLHLLYQPQHRSRLSDYQYGLHPTLLL